jgi:putative transcriptional regulator
MLFRLNSGRAARYFIWLIALALSTSSRLAHCGAFAGERDPSLVGKLIVAGEAMKDPRFIESVIYLIKDDHEGTMGFVINRPMAQGSIDDLLKGFGAEGTGSNREIVIHYGGPVSSQQGFLLHSDDVSLEKSMKAKDGLAATSDTKMIEAIALGKGPQQFLFMLGYAGWAPGQLEDEIKANSWFVVAADKSLIFGKDAGKKWRQAMDKRQIPL